MYRDDSAAPFLVTAFNDRVIALEALTGRVAWLVHLPVVRCAVENERVIVVSKNHVTALRYATGEELWKTAAGFEIRPAVTLLTTRAAIYASFAGQVLALDYDGQLLFRNNLPGTGYGTASLAIPGAVAHGDYA